MITNQKYGFTLIELLIVVAIIAILAAIAIPNFLSAQVRSKVSRARGDMRSIATALESYSVDYNQYPLMRGNVAGGAQPNRAEDTNGYGNNCTSSFRTLPVELTTPIAYITSTFKDPFKNPGFDYNFNVSFESGNPLDKSFSYTNIQEFVDAPGNGFDERDLVAYGLWRLCSIGPDTRIINTIGRTTYDPTNGTVSNGDLIRTQKSSAGERNDYTSGVD